MSSPCLTECSDGVVIGAAVVVVIVVAAAVVVAYMEAMIWNAIGSCVSVGLYLRRSTLGSVLMSRIATITLYRFTISTFGVSRPGLPDLAEQCPAGVAL